MAGFANGRAATGVHDDLWTRCLAMSSGGKPVVVCSVDVIGLFFEDVKKVRDGARAKLKREVDVIVASTHVHEGPDTPNRSEARTPC
jgi:neutral ceramidase